MILWVLVALCGGIGALCRWKLDGWIQSLWAERRQSVTHPTAIHPAVLACQSCTGIAIVNILGCGLAGFFSAFILHTTEEYALISTGFLGGFTTFSTAVMDVWNLWRQGYVLTGTLLACGTWALSLMAACVGYTCATHLLS